MSTLDEKKEKLLPIKTEFIGAKMHLVNAAFMFEELSSKGFDSTVEDIKKTIGDLELCIEAINRELLPNNKQSCV